MSEIIVKIKRRRKSKRKVALTSIVASTGIIQTRRENDYQARRVQNKILIRPYDLGMIFNDSGFIDLAFTRNHGFGNPFTLADLEDYENQFFEADFETWTEFYKRFEYANAFRLGLIYYAGQDVETFDDVELTTGNADWSENGLKLKTGKLVLTGQAFVGFDLFVNSDNNTKVTTVFNPEAEAVEDFQFKGTSDVFLVPKICLREAISYPGGVQNKLLGGFGIASRELFDQLVAYDFGAPTPIINRSLFAFANGTLRFTTVDPAFGDMDYANSRGVTDHINLDFASDIVSLFGSYPGAVTENGAILAADIGDMFLKSIGTNSDLYTFERKVLAAIVRQSNQTYYIWRTISATNDGVNQFSFNFGDGGGGEPEVPGAPTFTPLKAFRNLSSPTSIIVDGESTIGYTGVNFIELQINSEDGTPAQRKLRVTQTNLAGIEEVIESILTAGTDYTSENIIQIHKNSNLNKRIAKVEVADNYGAGFGAFGEINLKFLVSVNTFVNNSTFYLPYSTIEGLYGSGSYANGNWTFALVGGEVVGYPG